MVNCANKHIGRSYRLFPKTTEMRFETKYLSQQINEKLNALLYTMSHDLKYILPDFDVVTGKPRNYQLVLKWPSITHKNFGKTEKITTSSTILSKLDKTITNVFGGSKDLCTGIFETEKSTLTSVFGMLVDYKNQKIDDS